MYVSTPQRGNFIVDPVLADHASRPANPRGAMQKHSKHLCLFFSLPFWVAPVCLQPLPVAGSFRLSRTQQQCQNGIQTIQSWQRPGHKQKFTSSIWSACCTSILGYPERNKSFFLTFALYITIPILSNSYQKWFRPAIR